MCVSVYVRLLYTYIWNLASHISLTLRLRVCVCVCLPVCLSVCAIPCSRKFALRSNFSIKSNKCHPSLATVCYLSLCELQPISQYHLCLMTSLYSTKRSSLNSNSNPYYGLCVFVRACARACTCMGICASTCMLLISPQNIHRGDPETILTTSSSHIISVRPPLLALH